MLQVALQLQAVLRREVDIPAHTGCVVAYLGVAALVAGAVGAEDRAIGVGLLVATFAESQLPAQLLLAVQIMLSR